MIYQIILVQLYPLCLYADDTRIFSSSHDVDELAADLNSDLENISDCMVNCK